MQSFQELKRDSKKTSKSFQLVKTALLGDSATQLLAIAIKGMAIQSGYNLELYESDYSQIEHQVTFTESDLYKFDAEFTIIFHSTHKLLEDFNKRKPEERKKIATDRITLIESICKKVPGKIIYYNYPEIDDAVFGNLANQIDESFIYQTRKLNYKLMQIAQKYPDLYICDLVSIQNKIGRDSMFHAAVYINTDMVLSVDALPIIASRTIDLIRASKGGAKKCVVLDLDNTIWGGVIGDDGIEGIQLGHGLGIGKAYTEFQAWIKKLKERGIIIAINSKNNESIAQEPFVKHPEMILRLDDVAVFIANWENKADNIRKIQSLLNISFDSMVFIDDNPFERNIVRENISGILVPELPDDAANYLEYLYGLNLFETVSYSTEDINRTKQYQVEYQRIESKNSFTNETDFLKSLNMVSVVEDFTKYNIPRIAQLSQRSNQFNLRTVRYNEGDIELIKKQKEYHCFSFTLEDKFSNNGLICVIIMKTQDKDTLFIDSWFMSCRVLKRGMEYFALNTIVKYAKLKGYKLIIGEYLPTSKNSIAENHFSNLGFKKFENGDLNLFYLEISNFTKKECYIKRK